MRLVSLWVDEFKNLKDFTINFENQENLSIIIGNNGSGKSNLLELISAIFAELYSESTYLEEAHYKLVYKVNDKRIEIDNSDNTIYKVDNVVKNKTYLKQNNLIPAKVIAVYSGEDDRLYKTYYEPFSSQYVKDLSKQISPINRMLYLDKKFWNIALVSLVISAYQGNADHKEFIEKGLGIREILDVYLEFNPEKIKKIKYGSPLERWINVVNPSRKSLLGMSFDFFPPLVDYMSSADFFSVAAEGIEYKAIKDISIVFNDSIPSEDLSEGEKKKILIKAVADFVGTENSIILLDEPDSHIHVSGKIELYDMFKDIISVGRSIVATTHSPTITNHSDDKHIVMLAKKEDGCSEVISLDKQEKIKKLTGGLYNTTEQHILLSSSKPLVLVEGKSDICFIEKSLKLFRSEFSQLNFCMLSFGGTGNAKEFIENLEGIINPERKLIVIFDRDESGAKSGLKKCLPHGTSGGINSIKVYKEGNKNNYYLLLPRLNETDSGEFLIEDYFSKTYLIRNVKSIIKNDVKHVKSFRGFDDKIKEYLVKISDDATCDDMKGFKVLLKKIKAIIDEDAENLVTIE